MSNNITLRKAERKQAKLRIGLFGPSGAGKTMSALKLARGITEWDKICIIDTENRSADLYSKLGDYNVINIDAPYLPEKYIAAIDAAVAAGMEVIILDSITHEWAGKGGILELVDELADKSKNSFTVWGKLTPRHNAFIDAITSCPVDIICCGRSKQEYVLNQKEGKNGQMVNVPEKVGLKAVTREGFDYEMTVSFEIAINHYATTSKDRTGIFMDKPEFKISEETGAIIKAWNAEVAPDIAQQKIEIKRQLVRLGLAVATAEDFKAGVKLNTDLELEEKNYTEIIAKLRVIKPEDVKRPVEPKDNSKPTDPPAPAPAQPDATEAGAKDLPGETPAQEPISAPVSHETSPALPAKELPDAGAAHGKSRKNTFGMSETAVMYRDKLEAAPDLQALDTVKADIDQVKTLTAMERGVLNGAYTVEKQKMTGSAQGGQNHA